MAFGFWWLLMRVGVSDYEELRPHFEKAESAAQEKILSGSIVNSWRNNPGVIVGEMTEAGESLPTVEQFSREFNPSYFESLWDVVMERCEPTQENTISFTIYPGRPPLALLLLGLGPELAQKIPGVLGNFLLSKSDVKTWWHNNGADFVRCIETEQYKDVLQNCFANAICREDQMFEAQIEKIFEKFLAAFDVAIAKDAGLISMGVASR